MIQNQNIKYNLKEQFKKITESTILLNKKLKTENSIMMHAQIIQYLNKIYTYLSYNRVATLPGI